MGLKGLGKLKKKIERVKTYSPEKTVFKYSKNIQTYAREALRVQGAVDTGFLLRSVSVEMDTLGGSIKSSIGTNTNYAPYIEYGTTRELNSGAISIRQPRPYLRPAYYVYKDMYAKALQDEIRGLLK